MLCEYCVEAMVDYLGTQGEREWSRLTGIFAHPTLVSNMRPAKASR